MPIFGNPICQHSAHDTIKNAREKESKRSEKFDFSDQTVDQSILTPLFYLFPFDLVCCKLAKMFALSLLPAAEDSTLNGFSPVHCEIRVR